MSLPAPQARPTSPRRTWSASPTASRRPQALPFRYRSLVGGRIECAEARLF